MVTQRGACCNSQHIESRMGVEACTDPKAKVAEDESGYHTLKLEMSIVIIQPSEKTLTSNYQGSGFPSLVINIPVFSFVSPSISGNIVSIASSASIAPSSLTCVILLSTLPG